MDTLDELPPVGAAATRDAGPRPRDREPRVTQGSGPRIHPQDGDGRSAMRETAPGRGLVRQATDRSDGSIAGLHRMPTFASTASSGSRRCGWFSDGMVGSPSSSLLLSSVASLRQRQGDGTGHFQMASSFADELMVRLDGRSLVGQPKPHRSDEGLEVLMDAFALPEDFRVFYDPTLKTDGHTGRDKDPLVGPSAFEGVVHAEGPGEDCRLDDDMVALAVALTAAHEGTHCRQWDKYPAVALEGREDALARLPPAEGERIQRACERQKHLLESLAYQCEVFNLQSIRKTVPLPAGKLAQLQALQDCAVCRRDEHIDALPGEVASLLLRGSIDDALAMVLDGVPPEWLALPLSGVPWPWSR